MLPEESTAALCGLYNSAAFAGPPSPEKPVKPVPAAEVIILWPGTTVAVASRRGRMAVSRMVLIGRCICLSSEYPPKTTFDAAKFWEKGYIFILVLCILPCLLQAGFSAHSPR